MLNPAHILEVAFLLLAAFLIGASAGSVARILVMRMKRPVAVVAAPAEIVPVPVTAVEPALVAAPVIDPVAKPATPAAPDNVPSLDFSETVQAISMEQPEFALMTEIRMPSIAPLPALDAKPPKPEMAPAHVAGRTTSGIEVASPVVNDGPGAPEAGDIGMSAEVIPFPNDRVVGNAEGLAAPSAPVEEALAEMIVAVSPGENIDAEPTIVVPPEVENGPVEPAVEHAATEVDDRVEAITPLEQVVVGAAEIVDESAVAEVAPVVQVEPVPAVQPVVEATGKATIPVATIPEDDEAAAMRAIEGNWSPKRGASRMAADSTLTSVISADEAVAASAAAVSAATEAVKTAVAEPVEPPGKPLGIGGPRHGVKDNLTNIIGILPIIETALNNIGVYHFDQIARFTEQNVNWLEGHLGITGRIGREHWREQARELAIVSDRARRVAGQS